MVRPEVVNLNRREVVNLTVFCNLVGENDKMHSAREAVRRLNNIAPEIKTEVVQNAGHCLLFTHPEIVNEKILDFLHN